MAFLTKEEIIAGLAKLGELANAQGVHVRLLLVGGGAMVLAFGARASTRDVDVAILEPANADSIRGLAADVANELGWPGTWLNDAAKGFLVGLSIGPVVFASRGMWEAVHGND